MAIINIRHLLRDSIPDDCVELPNTYQDPNPRTDIPMSLTHFSREYNDGYATGFREGIRQRCLNDTNAYLFGKSIDYWKVVADYIAETPNIEKYLAERYYNSVEDDIIKSI